MFSDRLGQILDLLDITATQLARHMDVDRSNISRMTKGTRIPKQNGISATRLVNGIISYADEHGEMAELCEVIPCAVTDAPDEIQTALMQWLYQDGQTEPTPKPVGASQIQKDGPAHLAFGNKLSALMDLTGLSNVRLGKRVNMDASYIGRFRRGLRTPKSNPQLMETICIVLLDRIFSQDKVKQLSAMMKVSPQELEYREEALSLLYGWLYESEEQNTGPMVEGLVEQIALTPAKIKKPPLTLEEAASRELLADTSEIYFGIDGLRNAVIRFLGNVILRKESEVYLYSDQNMNWMTDDPGYLARWASLMTALVQGGTEVHIIHNIDRNSQEMAAAIRGWLPLYPSGRIHSYYSLRQKNRRFSTTLFLCPGYACIFGSNVIGSEDQIGVYRYDTAPALRSAYRDAYGELLRKARDLIQVYRTRELEAAGRIHTEGLTVFSHTLSLATMPRETLISMLDRNGIGQEMRQEMLLRWEHQSTNALAHMEQDYFHECVPLPPDEALFDDRVPMEIPELDIRYTPEEYAQHIRNIMLLLNRHVNYRFYNLPEVPFSDIRLSSSTDAAAVSRLKEPFITICFRHPDMCQAFETYAGQIKAQYKQDKITTKKLLERYI